MRTAHLCSLASAAAVAVAIGSVPASAATFFKATLSSDQEVSPAGVTNFPFNGVAHARLEDLGGGVLGLSYVAQLPIGLDYSFFATLTEADQIPDGDPDPVTRFHIHNAPRGVNGPVVYGAFNPSLDADLVVTLNADGSATVTGIWDATDGPGDFNSFVGAFQAAMPGDELDFYFNLHTFDDPAGVIRGQIIATAAPVPAGLSLMIFGLLGLGFAARRHARR